MYENNSREQLPKHREIKDYLQILRRRKWIVLLCLAVAVTAAVCYNRLSTPVYEAVAAVIYEEPRINILNAEAARPVLDRSAIINLTEQLKSRALAEELARALPKPIVQALKAAGPLNTNFSQEDLVIRKLQKNLQVEMVPGSDILKIKVTANDPVAAKIIANTYVERIIAWNLRKRREEIATVSDFVEKQLAVFQNKLHAAEEALRVFKEQNRMISLSNTSAEMLRRITDAEVAYNAVKSEREALLQRWSYIEQKKRQLAPSYVQASSPRIQQLKQRLATLEMQHSSLQIKGRAADQPEMLSIKREIELVKEELIQQLLSTAQQENLIDPMSQLRHLLQEEIGLEVNLETHKAREHVLQNILAGYDKEMQALPQQELELARLIREREVNDKIYSILLEKREEVRIAEAGRAGDVKLVDAAQEPVSPIEPKKAKNLALGLFLGLSLGVSLAFFSESLDTSLKSQQDVEEYMKLPVLVSIPAIHPNGATRAIKQDRKAGRSYGGRLLCHLEAGGHIYEAYRSLQTKFSFNGKHALKSILVTSPNAAEGKTLTAINMAQAFARSGIKTLLVDCDLRHPMIHRIFGIERELGLSDVLRNQCVLIEKVARTWAVQLRDNANLFVFPCGTLPPNPYEILNTPRMREVLAEFKRRYDLVILDSPPLMAVTDSVVVGNEVDAVCLVIKSGKTSRDEASRAQKLLENAQTNIIGTILNGIDVKKNGNGHYKSDYYLN